MTAPLRLAGLAETCAPRISALPAGKCNRQPRWIISPSSDCPQKLNLDATVLEREFYELSRKLHPDLYANAAKREQEWSLEQSSLLNDAYRTLKDPIQRTEYLFICEGVELEEQSKTATEKARAVGRQSRSRSCLPICWKKFLN